MQFLFHMQFRTRFSMSGSRRKPLFRHRNRARASMVVCHGLPLMSSVAIVSASSPSVIYNPMMYFLPAITSPADRDVRAFRRLQQEPELLDGIFLAFHGVEPDAVILRHGGLQHESHLTVRADEREPGTGFRPLPAAHVPPQVQIPAESTMHVRADPHGTAAVQELG